MNDGIVGPRTAFAMRTFRWTPAQLREALFEAERELAATRATLAEIKTLLASS